MQNALSYTQVQIGALNNVNRIYDRMAHLAFLAMDATLNQILTEKIVNQEFQELREYVLEIDIEQFNDSGFIS